MPNIEPLNSEKTTLSAPTAEPHHAEHRASSGPTAHTSDCSRRAPMATAQARPHRPWREPASRKRASAGRASGRASRHTSVGPRRAVADCRARAEQGSFERLHMQSRPPRRGRARPQGQHENLVAAVGMSPLRSSPQVPSGRLLLRKCDRRAAGVVPPRGACEFGPEQQSGSAGADCCSVEAAVRG